MLLLLPVAGKKGEENCFAKLTEAQVREIRELSKAGFRTYQIAKEFGISGPHAKRIILRQKWVWLK